MSNGDRPDEFRNDNIMNQEDQVHASTELKIKVQATTDQKEKGLHKS